MKAVRGAAYSSSNLWPPMESGWRKEVAVPWASDWMNLVTRLGATVGAGSTRGASSNYTGRNETEAP